MGDVVNDGQAREVLMVLQEETSSPRKYRIVVDPKGPGSYEPHFFVEEALYDALGQETWKLLKSIGQYCTVELLWIYLLLKESYVRRQMCRDGGGKK